MKEEGKGLIVSVSGPSGVGKGTVISRVREMRPGFTHSVSVTTRAPRDGEVEGVSYFFRTKEEFDRLFDEGEIIERDEFVGNYYGTPSAPLKKMSDEGKDVLLDLTVLGSLTLKEKFPDTITIFLLPPSMEELERRLRSRGTENEETIQRRLLMARGEIGKASGFDYVVVNSDVDEAAKQIIGITEAESIKYSRNNGIEKVLLDNGAI
ncbi:MAG: guanylate kinase [Clostridiales bacterium]|nr:guanylate kinase [Clostridiales bacterium]